MSIENYRIISITSSVICLLICLLILGIYTSKKKIENGYGLSNNRDITRELITANFKSDEVEYKWECSEYERKVYGKNYSVFGLNSRRELLKEKLWQIPAWRFMIKIYHKIR